MSDLGFRPDLFHLTLRDAASYFQSLVTVNDSEVWATKVNAALLSYVYHCGLIPHSYGVWLTVASERYPFLLRTALLDKTSRGVRLAGINSLKVALKSPAWRTQCWDAIGGASGLKRVFDHISVREVRALAKVIGGSATKDDVRSQAVEELVDLLIPGLTTDQSPVVVGRPLLHALIPLFWGCRDAFLAKALSNSHADELPVDYILQHLGKCRTNFLRRVATCDVSSHSHVRKRLLESDLLLRITRSSEPYSGSQSYRSNAPVPGVLGFGFELVRSFGLRPPDRRTEETILESYAAIIDGAIRLKADFSDVLAFLESIMTTKDRIKAGLSIWERLLAQVVRFWATAAYPEISIKNDISPAERQRELSHPSRPQPTHKTRLEAVLIEVLTAVDDEIYYFTTLSNMLRGDFRPYMESIPPEARLPLARLIFRHYCNLGFDIDSPTPSSKETALLPWSAYFILSLTEADSRRMFQRIQSSWGREIALVCDTRQAPWVNWKDDLAWFNEKLIEVDWESRNPHCENQSPLALSVVADCRLRAERARDGKERLDWAKRAIDTALMSKSVFVYREAAQWTSRFAHDPNTRQPLAQCMYSEDAALVLSIVELPHHFYPSLETLKQLIGEANSVLAYHVEAAQQMLRQPSYKNGQDLGLRQLICSVAERRINKLKRLYYLGLGDEDQLVEVLLESLVPVILNFEKAGTCKGRERLGWSGLGGVLDNMACPPRPWKGILVFLDRLAGHRDTMWTKERSQRGPKLATPKDGWPSGLPIQYLLPSEDWTSAALANEDAAPFVSVRVRDVIFSDPRTCAHQISNETQSLGLFADSLPFSIQSYVGTGSHRETRADHVWKYYRDSTPSNIGHQETFRDWFVDLARSRGLSKLRNKLRPALPLSLINFGDSSCDHVVEWDPRSTEAQEAQEAQPPPVTTLQYRFSASKEDVSLENWADRDFEPEPWKTADTDLIELWSSGDNFARYSLPSQEALVTSVLLFVEQQVEDQQSILCQAFPETSPCVRFPAVKLSSRFLSAIDDSDTAVDAAFSVLDRLLTIAPSSILYALGKSLQRSLFRLPTTSAKYLLVERCAYRIMQLIQKSDQPILAVGLGFNVIQELPDASSRHRSALTFPLGRALDHENAETMLQKFADFILGSLKKQNTADKSPVKITTIKMLAQLVALSNFISTASQINILRSLFEASGHIDVRVATCKALLRVAVTNSGNRAPYQLFKTWTHAAARPNERINTSEEDWLKAEQDGDLPEVNADRPLLSLFAEMAPEMLPSSYLEDYFQTALIPLVQELSRQHSRWMRAFIRQVGSVPEGPSVDNIGPFDDKLTEKLIDRWLLYLPKSFLLEDRISASAYLFFVQHKALNERLNSSDSPWRGTNAASHWSKFFSGNRTLHESTRLRRFLKGDLESRISNGINKEDAMEECFERAAIATRNPYRFDEDFYLRVSSKTSVREIDLLDLPNEPSLYSLGRRMVEYAESLRTEEWTQDPARSPPILPTPFQMQLYLIPYPHLHPLAEDRYEKFATYVIRLIDEHIHDPSHLANGHKLSYALVEEVKEADVCACMLAIGQNLHTTPNPRTQFIRADLAENLLDRLERYEWNSEVLCMIGEWKASPVEWVRGIGWSNDGHVENLVLR
ncbi:hypothetical protein BO94DRAFT_342319 [Aspergillus sclerotioniger CBS 115572]|uniref:Uncharacterized protein n=1 Tax=Aspergillus sclerotioniger CBS 115572 TaxID=1450535 RepID=A0A317X534_9EURO|nr:hypothetical protein BO94DRAFT_342319 [Aspergillus sclerotioniger CBS 115572]PWY93435.1 hypothetical protein BO94DRAFT_342319 [Aspergillus sclerotioniger CBS 115572]